MAAARAEDVVFETAEIVRPPRRMKVSDATEQYLRVPDGGGAKPWSARLVPYMIEPMDMLVSRRHTGVVFVGPAQSGKTLALIQGGMAYVAKVDPSDAMIVQTSQDTARDFSRRRVDRSIRHSPEIRARVSQRPRDDNTYDKHFTAGNILSIGWPSINQLSGRTIRFMLLTDYDRMPENVGGEGSPWTLSEARTRTLLSAGCVLAESSPGKDVTDGSWRPKTAHEAPPARGIVGLYNMGDRRRWYWPHLGEDGCGQYFEGGPRLDLVWIPEKGTAMERARAARLICPHCAQLIDLDRLRWQMNQSGVWVPDGMTVNEDGELEGDPPDAPVASYWLHGTAAAYQRLDKLVLNYLHAEEEFERTGSEELLRTTVNVDQGAPYRPKRLDNDRDPGELETRAEQWTKKHVPEGVRYLVMAVDVQKHRFVVQVHGYGVDLEEWPIDRYNIREASKRHQPDGEPEVIDPAAFAEDWDVLFDHLEKTYPLDDGSGRRMPIRAMVVDSGGEEGVTDRAYKFWRRAKKRGLRRRVLLVKGGSSKGAPRFKISYPDAERKDRKAKARGEIPVAMLNTDLLKDALDNDLHRDEVGPGYVHLPAWAGPWWYEELTAETRTDKGWEKVSRRNEALDLFIYARAANIWLKTERMNWEAPKPWALPWDDNPFILTAEETRQAIAEGKELYGEHAGDPDPPPAARQTTRRRTRRKYRSSRVTR